MSPSPIPGFITKTEVAETYGRSHRSLTRDFSRAIRVGDSAVLTHLRLHTEDGEVLEGPDVTLELIQELSNKGLTPTWYVEQQWAARTYPKDGSDSKPDAPASMSPSDENEQPTTPPKYTPEINRLEQQIKDLKRDKEDLREELKIKNEQIRDGHQRQKETNELIRELHHLMAHMQDRLLPAPAGSPAQRPVESSSQGPKPTPAREPEVVTDAQADSAKDSSVGEGESRASTKRRAPSTPKSQSAKKRPSSRTKSKPRSPLRPVRGPQGRHGSLQRGASGGRAGQATKKGTGKPRSRSDKKSPRRQPTKPSPSKPSPTLRDRLSSFFRRSG